MFYNVMNNLIRIIIIRIEILCYYSLLIRVVVNNFSEKPLYLDKEVIGVPGINRDGL